MWTELSDEMSYAERAKNLLATQFFYYMIEMLLPSQDAMFRKYHGKDFPSLMEVSAKSALAMVNAEEMFEFAKPISHKTIYIGGIGVGIPKKLDAVSDDLSLRLIHFLPLLPCRVLILLTFSR